MSASAKRTWQHTDVMLSEKQSIVTGTYIFVSCAVRVDACARLTLKILVQNVWCKVPVCKKATKTFFSCVLPVLKRPAILNVGTNAGTSCTWNLADKKKKGWQHWSMYVCNSTSCTLHPVQWQTVARHISEANMPCKWHWLILSKHLRWKSYQMRWIKHKNLEQVWDTQYSKVHSVPFLLSETIQWR